MRKFFFIHHLPYSVTYLASMCVVRLIILYFSLFSAKVERDYFEHTACNIKYKSTQFAIADIERWRFFEVAYIFKNVIYRFYYTHIVRILIIVSAENLSNKFKENCAKKTRAIIVLSTYRKHKEYLLIIHINVYTRTHISTFKKWKIFKIYQYMYIHRIFTRKRQSNNISLRKFNILFL